MIAGVAHPKGLPDHLRHPVGRPDVAAKAVGFRAAFQESWNLSALFGAQPRHPTWPGMTRQRFHAAPFSGAFEPLAHRAFTHPQRDGDVFLEPALRFEGPGAFPSLFAPVGFMWCSHTPHATTSLLPDHEISNVEHPRISTMFLGE
ncbi:MAG TPA: hypothetical protein VF792_11690 [Ktedonobacterales bacterium]